MISADMIKRVAEIICLSLYAFYALAVQAMRGDMLEPIMSYSP
jgi:hypothetical protein